MNLKFYDVGINIYYRNNKYVGWVGSAITAGGGLIGSLIGADSNERINQAQIELAQQQMEQEQQLFYDNLKFTKNESDLTRKYNAEQAALNREFQASQLDKNINWYENYNSPSAQVARHLDAGLNPASLSGNLGSTPTFSIPSGSAASSSPASGSGIPSFSLPHLLSSSDIFEEMGRLPGRVYDNLLKEQEIKKSETFNNYYDDILSTGLEISKEDARKLKLQQDQIRADIDVSRKNIDKLQQDISESASRVGLMDKQGKVLDEELVAKRLDNAFKEVYNDELIENLRIKNNIDSQVARYYVADLKARIAANLGSAAAAQSQAALNYAYKSLTPDQQRLVNSQADYYDQQKSGLIIENQLNRKFGDKRKKIELEGLEFDNSWLMKGAKFFNELTIPLVTLGGFIFATKGVKAYKPMPSFGFGTNKK